MHWGQRTFSRMMATFAAVLANSAHSETTRNYDIVTNGELNGHLEVTADRAARVIMHNHYQSQDKVRDLVVSYQLGPDGLPVKIDRAGQSFAFQPIDEHFAVHGASAVWRNKVESGSSPAARRRYYVPLGLAREGDSAAEELALLARAALRSRSHSLSLLPIGKVHVSIASRIALKDGRTIKPLQLVRIEGLNIQPDYVWLDANRQLFAARTTIVAGWRKVIPQLSQAQTDADAREVADALRRHHVATAPKTLLFRDVAIFDASRGVRIDHRDVLVENGHIETVAGANSVTAPRGGEVVEGAGKTLLPGLWDMHVHLSGQREVLRHLASGATTVRDMGNVNASLARLVGQVDGGLVPGPTIIRAGFIEARSPSATYTGKLVGSEAEAVKAVDDYADQGFAQIKLYNAVHPDWIAAIARETHRRGLRLSGHIPFGTTAEYAVRNGYDEIQHWVFLFLNFSQEPVFTGLTFNAARVSQTLDLNSPRANAFFSLLRDRHVATDLTLTVYEPLFRSVPGTPAAVFARSTANLPQAFLRQIAVGPLPTPPDLSDSQFRSTYDKALSLPKKLDRLGIQIEAGTDFAGFGGLALPRELELLVEAGLTPSRALQIATIDAARIMRRSSTTGSIDVGKDADLLLVDGDPTSNIELVRNVNLVVRHGIPYKPASLLAAAGIRQ